MSFLSQAALSFSLSTDAFAMSLIKGSCIRQKSYKQALKIGLLFGMVEMITPVIGWLIGTTASGYVASIDHWIVFFILVGIGGHIVYEAFFENFEDSLTEEKSLDSERSVNFGTLLLASISTSIDALAVGGSTAFLDVNIITLSLMVGCTTGLLVTIGILIGGNISRKWGGIAEIFGGLCLILIGIWVLVEHLGS